MTRSARLAWGLEGALALRAPVAVVVDVLSFSTTAGVALDAGVAAVHPYPWRDGSAAAYARQHDAVLAVGRSQAGPGEVSLSPLTLRQGTPPARLVLPSPNGSAISHALGRSAELCLAGSLRGAAALVPVLDRVGRDVVVVAAGERWPSGGLRVAVEDLWGAGALLGGLAERGWALDDEARSARAAYEAVQGKELLALLGCPSGRELVEAGWERDVAVAAEVGQGRAVPVLRGGAFVDGSSGVT